MTLTTLELCAGAGGQALDLARAGFKHLALIDNDEHACQSLRRNFPGKRIMRADIRKLHDPARFKGVDLLAAGLPRPPFSVAGQQLGADDERNLFPAMFDLVRAIRPKVVMIENVPGLMMPKFDAYREMIWARFDRLGYCADMQLLNASDFGVPQRRQRVVIVALRSIYAEAFRWPEPGAQLAPTVGEALYDLMAANGWHGADQWAESANDIAPTIVGGSKLHGGADLGPTRTRAAWAKLGIEGKSLADASPPQDFTGMPRLTIPMVARLQGFPDTWHFAGKKTHAYRQVGNALPPQLAHAVARQIRRAIVETRRERAFAAEHGRIAW